jgi:hypothetical protein
MDSQDLPHKSVEVILISAWVNSLKILTVNNRVTVVKIEPTVVEEDSGVVAITPPFPTANNRLSTFSLMAIMLNLQTVMA